VFGNEPNLFMDEQFGQGSVSVNTRKTFFFCGQTQKHQTFTPLGASLL